MTPRTHSLRKLPGRINPMIQDQSPLNRLNYRDLESMIGSDRVLLWVSSGSDHKFRVGEE